MSAINSVSGAEVPLPQNGSSDDLVTTQLEYSSSVDSAAPLVEDLCFIRDGKPKPVVAVLHGYSGNRGDVALEMRDLASKGLFAVAPDMRGRGGAGGKPDSSGLEIHDIVDGLLAAIAEYPSEIDPNNINFMGFSGGGGNGFAAVTRFPDLFNVAGLFFGIADYGMWYRMREQQFGELMRKWIGGSPAEKPREYASRNFSLAAGNNGQTRLHFFWDQAETACPPVMTEKFLETYHAAGLTNATAHISAAGDAIRWFHGYRRDNPMLAKADDILVPQILAASPRLVLPRKGVMTVCGYLVTRSFQVFVEDGRRGVVKIEYDLTGADPKVMVLENPDNLKVAVSLKSPLSRLPK